MSARGSGAFAQVLREVSSGLTVPLPARVHILRELAYDLEALSERFAAEGLPLDEARLRASEALVPDAGALHALERIHAPLYERFTAQITPERLRRWALVLVTATVLLTGGIALLQADLLDQASPFLWPVLVQGAVLFAAMLAKAFQLWIKRDHAVPWRGLNAILALVSATVLTGFVGLILDLYRLASTLQSSPELAGTLTPIWLVRDAALSAASLMIALAGVMGWFILRQWVAVAEGDQREVLGIGNTTRKLGRKEYA
jgi:hypothetical protein